MARTGRPRKAADGGVRRRTVHVNVTEAERERLGELAAAERRTLTDFVLMKTVYANAPGERMNGELLAGVYAELRAQGRNINQIAKAANRLANMKGGAGRAGNELARMAAEVGPKWADALDALSEVCAASWPRKGPMVGPPKP